LHQGGHGPAVLGAFAERLGESRPEGLQVPALRSFAAKLRPLPRGADHFKGEIVQPGLDLFACIVGLDAIP
jgi:hypothetical protein